MNFKTNFTKDDSQRAQKIENQHYDEAVELSDQASEIMSGEDEEEEQQQSQVPGNNVAGAQTGKVPLPQGAYNSKDYDNLKVSPDIKDLFTKIDFYKPITIEIDAPLKPFIPEYIPAIGEVDAFMKMSRPDGTPETLGLVQLDEPSLNQSKKAKLDLMMREYIKVANRGKQTTVHSIEEADKNPKEISAWINDVGEIHKSKQAPSVSYSKPMPDIDTLMQVWPQEMEDYFNENPVPGEAIDLNLAQYCQLACTLLDIPVHSTNNNKNVIESLHVLFTLYSEFKANQHFQQNNEEQ